MIEAVVFDVGECLVDETREYRTWADWLDNDVRPAAAAGLRTALVRRGPWATIQRDDPDAGRVPTLRTGSLAELPARIAGLNAAMR